MRRLRSQWTGIVLAAFVVVQLSAAAVYNWTHPELTEIQVWQAIAEWSIPARWM